MSKTKSYDESLELVNAKKEELANAKNELREFREANKIKRGKPVEDVKLAAQLEKKEAAIEKLRETLETLKAETKELKPRTQKMTKYEYPADIVSEKDKKKYRQKMRSLKKKAEKGETEEVKAGSGEAAEEATATLKKKVVKKKAAETPNEEED